MICFLEWTFNKLCWFLWLFGVCWVFLLLIYRFNLWVSFVSRVLDFWSLYLFNEKPLCWGTWTIRAVENMHMHTYTSLWHVNYLRMYYRYLFYILFIWFSCGATVDERLLVLIYYSYPLQVDTWKWYSIVICFFCFLLELFC